MRDRGELLDVKPRPARFGSPELAITTASLALDEPDQTSTTNQATNGALRRDERLPAR